MIAYVSAIFLLPVFDKMAMLSAFSAIMHGMGTVQGGNTVLCDGKSDATKNGLVEIPRSSRLYEHRLSYRSESIPILRIFSILQNIARNISPNYKANDKI